MDTNEWVDSRTILRVYAGSHSYGMNTKDSDEDFRGVAIPPIDYLLGLHNFDSREKKEPYDEVIYSLERFVDLAIKNNPNILDALFVAPNHIVFSNEFGKGLREMRYTFLSKQVFKTYGGYAMGQLHKMTAVNTKQAFGKRKESFERYGYDTKDAAHLIRLMRMGIEILTEGEVNVLRHDAKELLEIRNGKYTVADIKDEYENLNGLLREAYVRSSLPAKPDFNKINTWLVQAQLLACNWKGNV